MKVYFVRHGEGLDDVYNEFGSWSDRELSPYGVQVAFNVAEKLGKLEKKFGTILTSPLKRASKTAEIVGAELSVRVDQDPLLKERNTYGLLSGVNKDLAISEYPEMNAAFLEGKYIPASERYKDFVDRVKILLDNLKSLRYENIICVTHGHLITVILEEFMGLTRNSIGDGSIVGIDFGGDKMKVIHADGVDFTKNEAVARGVEYRKFKKD
ncbi:MAG: histidine phosphatase family protein [Patescibacteria group bacterium]|nr:histidine phosphatase family protein [Patescibacteria group bacterium]